MPHECLLGSVLLSDGSEGLNVKLGGAHEQKEKLLRTGILSKAAKLVESPEYVAFARTPRS